MKILNYKNNILSYIILCFFCGNCIGGGIYLIFLSIVSHNLDNVRLYMLLDFLQKSVILSISVATCYFMYKYFYIKHKVFTIIFICLYYLIFIYIKSISNIFSPFAYVFVNKIYGD